MEKMMNDNQFEALIGVLRDISDEIMFLRDEVSGLRDIYGQVHGFESDLERDERIERIFKDEKLFEAEDANSNLGSA